MARNGGYGRKMDFMGRHSGNTRVAWLRRGLNLGLCLLGWGIGLATAATGAPLPDLGGDDPQVCARSADMRVALLDALTPVGGVDRYM